MNGPVDGYDSALTAIRNHIEASGSGWPYGRPAMTASRTRPPAGRPTNAVDAIDGGLAELHTIRQQLISEIRVADDNTTTRADALLADAPEMTSRARPGRRGHQGPAL